MQSKPADNIGLYMGGEPIAQDVCEIRAVLCDSKGRKPLSVRIRMWLARMLEKLRNAVDPAITIRRRIEDNNEIWWRTDESGKDK